MKKTYVKPSLRTELFSVEEIMSGSGVNVDAGGTTVAPNMNLSKVSVKGITFSKFSK